MCGRAVQGLAGCRRVCLQQFRTGKGSLPVRTWLQQQLGPALLLTARVPVACAVADAMCRCCAFAPVQPSCEDDEQVVPRIYVGTQPADLIYSDDLGSSFASCELSEAPQADSWYRRLPPYEPSVRAINFAGSRVAAAAAVAAGGVEQQQHADLMVAVEVG